MSKYMIIEFNDRFKRKVSSQTINTNFPVLVVYENQFYNNRNVRKLSSTIE